MQHVIAVASGKGGVGKSTLAVNLAMSLHALGKSVGLLDADIYGPSIPLMMNLKDRQPTKDDKNLIIPLENYGLRVMSMGNLMDPERAVIWRGPMVASAVEQLLHKVAWGPLDILVTDLPPGTGDAQLTLCQSVQLAGAIMISTPQDVALSDVRRGTNMFKQVDVPILGMVQNMNVFVCPCCKTATHIFGDSGAKTASEEMGIDFLGDVPIDVSIRQGSDSGQPVVAALPESPSAAAYTNIAIKIISKLQSPDRRPSPKFVVEE